MAEEGQGEEKKAEEAAENGVGGEEAMEQEVETPPPCKSHSCRIFYHKYNLY